MGLAIANVSRFCIRLANHHKFRFLGIMNSLEVEAYAIRIVVDFHVMPIDLLGAYPIVLGRP